MTESDSQLLDFRKVGTRPWQKRLLSLLQSLADPVVRGRGLNEHYAELLRRLQSGEGSFYDTGLDVLGVRYKVSEEDLKRIPKEGPVFVLANHPYGGVDGLVLGSILDRVRPDSKLLVNYLLGKINDMGGRCFYVNPFGGEEATRANLKGMKESLRWLRQGHALATFPAGTVSHLKWWRRRVTDPTWVENIAPLILKSKAVVVPMYFEGRNSNLFQAAGLVHPLLRTAMLGREMLNNKNREIKVRIGNPISAKRLLHFGGNREIMDFLRLRTYIQKSRNLADKTVFLRDARKAHTGQPIVKAEPIEKIEEELNDLPPESVLWEQDPFIVYAAKAPQIPHTLLELGRLREITFRAVGEGTGDKHDLDKFDSLYWHLFIWNREEREIVGAYRLGLTDEIMPEHGKSGLYTTTLFRIKTKVLNKLNPAIELGRSFIVQKYQRKPVSLGLLWKGIGQFICRHPSHCMLFGPVSISTEYQGLSKNLMVTFLREHSFDQELGSKVKARHPMRSRFFDSLDKKSFKRSVRDIEDVSALISEIEEGDRGVPVLLRQYMKMNASFLSFNVDPLFNDSLDGLMVVDLRNSPAKALARYMTPSGAEAFIKHHETSHGPRIPVGIVISSD